MPTYEMPMLLRIMNRPDLTSSLKRVAQLIFDKGGFIRKMDNLGKRTTPYKMSSHEHTHREANYFVFYFDIPPTKLPLLQDEYGRDLDIIKSHVLRVEDVSYQPCTLSEEMLPPPYRPSVQKLIKTAEKEEKKKLKHKFQHNSGLSYYPFQR